MRHGSAIAALCVVLAASGAQAAPGGDYVLFKAKVTAADYLGPLNEFQDGENLVLIEASLYRHRLAVDEVLIGDMPERTVFFDMGSQGMGDPTRTIYVLARRNASGKLDLVETSPGRWGLCFHQDWSTLGIAAEWRAQSARIPCDDRQ